MGRYEPSSRLPIKSFMVWTMDKEAYAMEGIIWDIDDGRSMGEKEIILAGLSRTDVGLNRGGGTVTIKKFYRDFNINTNLNISMLDLKLLQAPLPPWQFLIMCHFCHF